LRKLSYYVATTADGFIAREDGGLDCFPGEGRHIPDYLASLESFGAVVMGRRTYQVGLDMGVTNPYPALRTYVVSRSLEASPDPAVTLVSGDPAALVRSLKQEPGKPIYLCGGAHLATQLLRQGLVDEVVVKLNPLLLGTGIPLVAAIPEPVRLRLRDTRVYEDSGVVFLWYDVVLDGVGATTPAPG